ncbi:unnamed protein product [Allacma fusca]|uniref:Peptidase aspartic putative domain-containing protein n=1 Tax=Allacma fusca TaxID=39272 RepID=A0A8J2KBB8_9HEXA|nr:unnamed protein product [Allacma fusca]
MCPDVPKGKIETDKKPIDGTALSNQIRSTEGILQTLLVRVKRIACNHVLRALLDTELQKSYLSECAAKALRPKCKDQVKIAHSLFGGGQTAVKEHRVIDIHVESLINNFSCSLSDQPVICGKISRVQNKLLLDELKMAGVELTDTGEGATDINLLFGADVLGKLYTGKILPTQSGPVSVETKLGWTVIGSLSSDISMPTPHT